MAAEAGDCARSIELFKSILTDQPDAAELYNDLGTATHLHGDFVAAGHAFQHALNIKPDFVAAASNIGMTLHELKLTEQAAAWYSKALEMDWTNDLTYNRLGILLRDKQHQEAAIRCYKIAIALNPSQPSLYNNIASSLQSLGKLEESEKEYERAIILHPGMYYAWDGLIFTYDLDHRITKERHQEIRREFAVAQAALASGYRRPHTNDIDPDRKLRIGYVSGDCWEHSASYIWGGVLSGHDPKNCELFMYSNSKLADQQTARLMGFVENWRIIASMSDEKVCDLIRQDKIDILVDLSGHSSGNRLQVFARKPAPVQVHAWGYATGTGLSEIDYYFADETVIPHDEHKYHTEKIRYLPCLVTSDFPNDFPNVGPLPATIRGHVVFGSMARVGKISDECYQAWAEILHAVPDSELIMKTMEFDSQEVRNKVMAKFAAHGITGDRIIFGGRTHWMGNICILLEIDIVLDSFPHGGGTTAMETLMMGVPYISLLGKTLGARGSSSILKTIGLGDWVSNSVDEYIKIAVEKASDLEALAKLRGELRGIFQNSVVGDSKKYCQIVEGEYRKIWQKWCEQQEMKEAA